MLHAISLRRLNHKSNCSIDQFQFEQNVPKNAAMTTAATNTNTPAGNAIGVAGTNTSATTKPNVDLVSTVESSAMTSTAPHPVPSPYTEPLLCIAPPADTTIYRPYVNLTDFLTSSNSICLNSYEERIEASVRGESLCAEHMTNFKEMTKSSAKRQRHDSGSEKKSPDAKRTRNIELDTKPTIDSETLTLRKMSISTSQDGMSSTSADESTGTADEKYDRDFASPTHDVTLFEIDGIAHMTDASSADEGERDEAPPLMSTSIKIESNNDSSDAIIKKEDATVCDEPVIIVPDCIKRNLSLHNRNNKRTDSRGQLNSLGANSNKKRDLRHRDQHRDSYRPLINDEVLQKMRKGWTLEDVGDITIGDLYLMFGQDGRVRLEYRWKTLMPNQFTDDDVVKSEHPQNIGSSNITAVAAASTSGGGGAGGTEMLSVKNEHDTEIKKPKNALSNKLKQLLMLAGMTEKTKKRTSCACGHYCDRSLNKVKVNKIAFKWIESNEITRFSRFSFIPFSSERGCAPTQLHIEQNISNVSRRQ